MYLFNIINIFLNNVIDTGDIMLKKIKYESFKSLSRP